MDRRLFLLSGAAGLADPVTPLLHKASAAAPVTTSGDPAFDAWAQDFVARAVAAGWPEDLLRRELGGLTPDPKVVEADRRQPEFTRPVGAYMATAVSDARVETGGAKLAELADTLARIEARFGVDRAILLGVWGMETNFGAFHGDMDVIRSLATLAADGRRRAWAEGELFAALQMIARGRATRAQLVGSWAGAMGHTQFIPSTYMARAVDEDGDGKADIWSSAPDALASAANLLAKAGWAQGKDWAREVVLPAGFDYALLDSDQRTPGDWASMGVRRADGRPWPEADAAAAARVIAPAGAAGPIFLALPNHYVIRRYNNSAAYALAVGLLADRITGAPPLVTPWPEEAPMSREQRVGAQAALNRLGFDVGAEDGVIGTRTRTALRAWQAAKGLVPDGHLTAELADRLRAEAAAAP